MSSFEEEEFPEDLQDKFDSLPLKIELIPTSCWWSNVRSNVTKSQWDLIRKNTYKNTDYKCEICGGQGTKHPVECHEVWNYDEENQLQTLKGFVSLCPLCHEVKHFGLANKLGNGQRALERFTTINNLNSKEAHLFLRKFFMIHRKRSMIEWNFDISIIADKYGINITKTKFHSDDRLFFDKNEIDKKLERERRSTRKDETSKKKSKTTKNISSYTIDKDDFKCPYCSSTDFSRHGKSSSGKYRYKCKDCKKSFSTEIKTNSVSELLKNLPKNLFD